MINENTLTYLSGQKQKDAIALLSQNRNSGAIYLMGYALEFSFKRKIIQTLGFANGFPESRLDYNTYSTQISAFNAISTGIILTQLNQLKNHNLNQLIVFSGAENRIKSLFFLEWLIIQNWNPEDRYKIRRYRQYQARECIRAARVILEQIT